MRAIGAMSQKTSTGTANVQSFATPTGATGMLVTVETNPCRLSLDGTAPGATSLLMPTTTVAPAYVPCAGSGASGQSVQIASNIAGNSLVTVQFLQ